jgi:hypothetical protein
LEADPIDPQQVRAAIPGDRLVTTDALTCGLVEQVILLVATGVPMNDAV